MYTYYTVLPIPATASSSTGTSVLNLTTTSVGRTILATFNTSYSYTNDNTVTSVVSTEGTSLSDSNGSSNSSSTYYKLGQGSSTTLRSSNSSYSTKSSFFTTSRGTTDSSGGTTTTSFTASGSSTASGTIPSTTTFNVPVSTSTATTTWNAFTTTATTGQYIYTDTNFATYTDTSSSTFTYEDGGDTFTDTDYFDTTLSNTSATRTDTFTTTNNSTSTTTTVYTGTSTFLSSSTVTLPQVFGDSGAAIRSNIFPVVAPNGNERMFVFTTSSAGMDEVSLLAVSTTLATTRENVATSTVGMVINSLTHHTPSTYTSSASYESVGAGTVNLNLEETTAFTATSLSLLNIIPGSTYTQEEILNSLYSTTTTTFVSGHATFTQSKTVTNAILSTSWKWPASYLLAQNVNGTSTTEFTLSSGNGTSWSTSSGSTLTSATSYVSTTDGGVGLGKTVQLLADVSWTNSTTSTFPVNGFLTISQTGCGFSETLPIPALIVLSYSATTSFLCTRDLAVTSAASNTIFGSTRTNDGRQIQSLYALCPEPHQGYRMPGQTNFSNNFGSSVAVGGLAGTSKMFFRHTGVMQSAVELAQGNPGGVTLFFSNPSSGFTDSFNAGGSTSQWSYSLNANSIYATITEVGTSTLAGTNTATASCSFTTVGAWPSSWSSIAWKRAAPLDTLNVSGTSAFNQLIAAGGYPDATELQRFWLDTAVYSVTQRPLGGGSDTVTTTSVAFSDRAIDVPSTRIDIMQPMTAIGVASMETNVAGESFFTIPKYYS